MRMKLKNQNLLAQDINEAHTKDWPQKGFDFHFHDLDSLSFRLELNLASTT